MNLDLADTYWGNFPMTSIPQLLYKSRHNLYRLELDKTVDSFEEIGLIDPLDVKSFRISKETIRSWLLGNTV